MTTGPSGRSATVGEIARFLGLTSRLEEDDRVIDRASGIEDACARSMVFAADGKVLAHALASEAGLILAREDGGSARVLVVAQPRVAFARAYWRFLAPLPAAHIAPSAQVAASARLGEGCFVGAGALIEAGVQLGRDCWIGPNVVIHAGTVLGERVKVQAGAVLGSDGFGFVQEAGGVHLAFPQLGTLQIGDDVEVGANCTIDRGALGATTIGRGTKIDNLVHIAHNCRIGEDVIIAAQVGMAGSCVIEDGVMLGGQVGLGERVTIARGTMLGGQGGVLPGKTLGKIPGEIYWGTPARPVREYLRDLVRLRPDRG